MSSVLVQEGEWEQLTARFAELYAQLNAEQRQAVETTEGPVMVLAGPGTGKTQLLAMRIAKILRETQMDPWNILCVTFTESGAVAMRERLHAIVGTAAYYVRIHTFHSFCNEIIQAHPDIFALARQWQSLSEVERLRWMEELVDELPGTSPLKPFGNPYLYVRDVVGAIQSLKQEGVTPAGLAEIMKGIREFVAVAHESMTVFAGLKPNERTAATCETLYMTLRTAAKKVSAYVGRLDQQWHQYQERVVTAVSAAAESKLRTAYKSEVKGWFDQLARVAPRQQELARVFERYQERLRTEGRYDYEDMLMHVGQAWRDHDDLLATYQERFQYIMVDEYQDTNGAQNEILRLLGSFDEQPNICVVGDDKQSIYRFQGASLANMLDFYERFKEHVVVVSLRENYRSQPTVLAAAQAVITQNTESVAAHIAGVTQELVPGSGRVAQPLERVTLPSEAAEDWWVARRIQELIARGVRPREIAVLFRYHRDVESLFQVLRQQGTPVRLEGGEDALEDRIVGQLLTVLQYIAGQGGDELLARMVFYEWLGVTALDALKVVGAARQQSLVTLVADTERLQEIGVADPAILVTLVSRLAHWRQLAEMTTPLSLIHTVIVESGLLSYVVGQPERLTVLQKLARVLDEARALHQERAQLSLNDFLGALGTLRSYGLALAVHPWQVADEAVRLLTAHRAKGLEFEQVFIIRLNDKHWGNAPEPRRLPLPAGVGHSRAVPTSTLIEDERRLFYVALTRARQGVVLTRAEHTAKGRPTVPSLFWQEVPAETVEQQELHEDVVQEMERLTQSLMPATVTPSAALDGWLKERLRTLRLSATHITNYLECPRLFYVRNVLRVPTPLTPPQALGAALHGALEDWLHGHGGGQVPAKETLLRHFQRRLRREILTPQELHDALAVGEQRLDAYYQQLGSELPAVSLGEYDFSSHGVQLDGIPLTGRVDRIDVIDEARKTVRLVDYKSSKPESARAWLKPGGTYHRQLVFYALLARLSPQFVYEISHYEVHFLQPDRRGKFIRAQVEVSDADIEQLTELIHRLWQEIQSLAFVAGGGQAFCGECEYCHADDWLGLRSVSLGGLKEIQVQ